MEPRTEGMESDICGFLVVAAAKDVVRQLLCVDPAKRISLAELLHHPWFTVSIELTIVDHMLCSA